MVASFLVEVWGTLYIRGDNQLKKEHLFGFLKFKYKLEKMRCGNLLELEILS